jgi:glycosyltransferase involved in cell wall biosynthesis
VLTVIIPVYNEEGTVRLALERLLKAGLPVPLEIVVVDDGSSDCSASAVSDFVKHGDVRLMRHLTNRGKGAAVRTGLAAATGDIITILDADLECDPRDYREMLEAIGRGARVVYGVRRFGPEVANLSRWRTFGNRLISRWASLLYGASLADVETCFKMATADAWRSLRLTEDGFGIEVEATAKFLRNGERIHQVPIAYRPRGFAQGKHLRWTDGLAALWILARVRLLGR